MIRFLTLQIVLFVIALLTIHTPTKAQRRGHLSTSDSTKLPSELKSVEVIRTTTDSSSVLKLSFLTQERPDALYKTYDVDSIQLFAKRTQISLTTVEKDTLCFDSTFTMFCNWYFKFKIDAKQRQFLQESDIDKMKFYSNGYCRATVYPMLADKKLFRKTLSQ